MRFVTVFISLGAILGPMSASGCRTAEVAGSPPIVQPGAPGQASRVISAEKATDLSKIQFTPADVRFMQGMIGHHAQALEMAALVPSRSGRDDVKLIAQRIALSQADEIKMMQEWLARRGEPAPDAHAHHAMMPGMLTADEMSHLEAATGVDFDRLFVQLMIKHHGGALTMVDELFSDPGAGQDPELFAFASDVDVDQRGEIARLAAMLKELSK
jgi:uncharacterized protein (DUF305 family)